MTRTQPDAIGCHETCAPDRVLRQCRGEPPQNQPSRKPMSMPVKRTPLRAE
eukprot:NODE_21195_length_765_cov_1.158307.p2 GENE.NODE_21195_length_765_cov_1.158307~~NODE_21195_length_765_cov_1.158307.p2  ORF type:complete len:51 (+),score=5.98 NODE_21195_length_765_cov_1.158307:331-483(+)